MSAEGNYFVPLFTISFSHSGSFYLECTSMPTVIYTTTEPICNHLNCFHLKCTTGATRHTAFQGHMTFILKHVCLCFHSDVACMLPSFEQHFWPEVHPANKSPLTQQERAVMPFYETLNQHTRDTNYTKDIF